MRDDNKTKDQLIMELKKLRALMPEMDLLKVDYNRTQEALQETKEELENNAKERADKLGKLNKELRIELTELKRTEKVQKILFNISQATCISKNLDELLKTIHYQLGSLIDTTNFYIALYDEKNDIYTFPYHVDQYDDNFTPQPLKKSLTDYVRRTGESLLADEKMHKQLRSKKEVELIGPDSPIWLGSPLKTAQGIIGVVVVQSYTDSALYSNKDLELLNFVSGHIAMAIERKKAQEALSESEEKYKTLADQSLVGIFIFQEGRIVYANQGFSDITQYSLYEILKWKYEELAKIIHPEDRSFVIEQLRKKQAGEKDIIPRYSYRMITKSGKIKLVEIYSKTMNYSGRLAVQGVLVDITDRKLTEEALKESEEKFKGLYENANDSIVIINKEGYISLANPKFLEITGYSNKEVTKVHFTQLIHPGDKDLIISYFERVLAGETNPQIFEVRGLSKDGSIIYIDINANIIKKRDEVIGIQAIIRDITEKRVLEERLKENYKELVTTIAAFIEIKDLYTENHSRRIVEDSIYLAQQLKMSAEEIKDIEIAALLHDLGKIKIPEKILNKRGHFNPQEKQIMRKHSQLGEEGIKNMVEFRNASKLIKHHHERYDGEGYPDGLKGDKIPLGARIIALVDAFDAMQSDRPYRQALSYEEAKEEFIRERGKQFDPFITDIYLKYLKNKYEND